MAYKLEFHPDAEAEFDEALSWYESQKEGLGQNLFNDYIAIEDRLKTMPEQFPLVMERVRRANLSQFPFSVFFVIIQTSVFVYAVFHQKRNPQDWVERL